MDSTFSSLSKNFSSNKQKKNGRSEDLYEDVITKNFQIISELLKKLNSLFIKQQQFQDEMQNVHKKMSKLQNQLQTIHNEHRRDNLYMHSNVDSLKCQLDGLDRHIKEFIDQIKEKGIVHFLELNKMEFKKQSYERRDLNCQEKISEIVQEEGDYECGSSEGIFNEPEKIVNQSRYQGSNSGQDRLSAHKKQVSESRTVIKKLLQKSNQINNKLTISQKISKQNLAVPMSKFSKNYENNIKQKKIINFNACTMNQDNQNVQRRINTENMLNILKNKSEQQNDKTNFLTSKSSKNKVRIYESKRGDKKTSVSQISKSKINKHSVQNKSVFKNDLLLNKSVSKEKLEKRFNTVGVVDQISISQTNEIKDNRIQDEFNSSGQIMGQQTRKSGTTRNNNSQILQQSNLQLIANAQNDCSNEILNSIYCKMQMMLQNLNGFIAREQYETDLDIILRKIKIFREDSQQLYANKNQTRKAIIFIENKMKKLQSLYINLDQQGGQQDGCSAVTKCLACKRPGLLRNSSDLLQGRVSIWSKNGDAPEIRTLNLSQWKKKASDNLKVNYKQKNLI